MVNSRTFFVIASEESMGAKKNSNKSIQNLMFRRDDDKEKRYVIPKKCLKQNQKINSKNWIVSLTTFFQIDNYCETFMFYMQHLISLLYSIHLYIKSAWTVTSMHKFYVIINMIFVFFNILIGFLGRNACKRFQTENKWSDVA